MLSGDGGSGVSGTNVLPTVPVVSDAVLLGLVEGLESAVAGLAGAGSTGVGSRLWSNADRRAVLARVEAVQRSLTGHGYSWLNELITQNGLDVYPGAVPSSLAAMLHITPRDAGARIKVAQELGDRVSLTGDVLPAQLPAVAAALRAGVIGDGHVRMIRDFFTHLPAHVDVQTREKAQEQVVGFAATMRPDELAPVLAHLDALLNPDGDFDPDGDGDGPRPPQRRDAFFYLGVQGGDGMSEGNFCVDAETRAYLEAIFAKWAKPGMCNPADPAPITDDPTTDEQPNTDSSETDDSVVDVGGVAPPDHEVREHDREFIEASPDASPPSLLEPEPTPGTATPTAEAAAVVREAAAAAARDVRGERERRHDALKTVLRQMLASGSLGTHRGLPVTAVVTMTLRDLETCTGYAMTATGSRIAMRDAIRMASHAHHYLTIFDDHGRPIHLGRTKRLASADQRIVLLAADRGCTFPACTRPATWCQAHHVTDWVDGGTTDTDTMTFACDMHHALVGTGPGQWSTTKPGTDAGDRYRWRTRWHPPAEIDPTRRGRINHAHHPEEVLYPPGSGHGLDGAEGEEEPRQPA